MNKKLAEVMIRAERWPESAQRKLAAVAEEIDRQVNRRPHRATPEELAAIDEANDSGVATEDEVAAAFAAFRS